VRPALNDRQKVWPGNSGGGGRVGCVAVDVSARAVIGFESARENRQRQCEFIRGFTWFVFPPSSANGVGLRIGSHLDGGCREVTRLAGGRGHGPAQIVNAEGFAQHSVGGYVSINELLLVSGHHDDGLRRN